jgi:two-component system NarL family sensor kinase
VLIAAAAMSTPVASRPRTGRAVFELHPYVLDEVGLAAALRRLADQTARRAGLPVDVQPDNTVHIGTTVCFSVARELLANSVRHAQATRIELTLRERDGATVLTVADDGRGIDPTALDERPANGHIGLASHRVVVSGSSYRSALTVGEPSGATDRRGRRIRFRAR